MLYHTRQHKDWPTVTDPGHLFCGFGGLHPHPAAYLLRGPKAVTLTTAGDGAQSLVWLWIQSVSIALTVAQRKMLQVNVFSIVPWHSKTQ